jgi:hypothetical protein
LIKKETYNLIFNESFQSGLHDISKNPLHNLFGKSPISEISEYCEDNEFFKEKVKEIFCELADLPCNIVLSDDRELLFTKLHSLRLSEDIQHLVEDMKQKDIPHPDEMNNFVQVFLMNMTKCLLENMTKMLKKECNKDCTNISDNEQKVLFYISGYIIHALHRKYARSGTLNKQKLNHVLGFSTDKSSETTKKYASMLENKDKGGLKLPKDNLFYMIRSMERVVSKNVDMKSLIQQSLDKTTLKETLMEDFMVKIYIEKLCMTNETTDEDSEHVVSGLLEDICHLFVTIRGFAMAKLQRNKLQSVCKSEKSGNSFRNALKEKCSNIKK